MIGAGHWSAPLLSGDKMPRLRDLGYALGQYPTGPLNAITDVAGVAVGHVTLSEGDRTRTGATAILAHPGNLFQDKRPAALAVLNGFGKFAGATQLAELGQLETPILLTNTLAVGRAIDAINGYTLDQPGNERVTSLNAVVGETNDSRLNDIRAARPTVAEMRAAIDAARPGAVAEGAVGAGTGTVAFGMKGGVGTASRLVGGQVLGVLVQANFGGHLRVDGVPVANLAAHDADGSIVIVLATDAALDAGALRRLATRAFGGLARTGAALSHGSGDYALAFSTQALPMLSSPAQLSALFEAAIEATEEAILNALTMAEDMHGYDTASGLTSHFAALRLPPKR